MSVDDLKEILPDFAKPSFKHARFILLGAVGLMLLAAIVLGCLVGVQLHNKTAGAESASAQNFGATGMCISTQCMEVVSRMSEKMDPSIDPCHDFYKFACASWERSHGFRPYHDEESVMHTLFRSTFGHVRDAIELPLDNNAPSSAKRKIQDLLHACLNENRRIGEDGKVMLQMIKDSFKGWYVLDPDGWKDNGWNLQEAIAKVIGDLAVPVLFSAKIGKLWNTPNNVIILTHGGAGMNNFALCSFCEVRKDEEAYKDYIREVATALLEDGDVTMDSSTKQQRLQQFVNDAYGQEAKIAALITSGSKENNYWGYRKILLTELERNFTQISWRTVLSRLFSAYTLNDDTYIWVNALPYFRHLNQLLVNETDLQNKDRIMNNYLVWRVLDAYTEYSSWKYMAARWHFQKKTNSWYYYGHGEGYTRWHYQICISAMWHYMHMALVKEYLTGYIGISTRDQIADMFKVLQNALAQRLDSVTWMDNVTATIGRKKILNVDNAIGCPQEYLSNSFMDNIYDGLTINASEGFLANVFRAASYKFHLRSQSLSEEDADWRISHSRSTIGSRIKLDSATGFFLVPTRVMQFPLFLKDGPAVFNYGSLGSQILSRLSESIGERGRTLTPDGTNEDWWSADTSDKYQAEKDCFVKYFNGTSLGPYMVNGQSVSVPVRDASRHATNMINLVAGFKAAFNAYRSLPYDPYQIPIGLNLTADQMFFLAAAQTQCYIRTDKGAYSAAKKNQIPPDKMLNAALSFTEEFAEAFSCPLTAPMVQENKCTVF